MSYFEAPESKDQWLKGIEIDRSSNFVRACFNSTFKGWKYIWRSHRYSSHVAHCFRVHACILKSTTLVVQDIYSSPSFELYSRSKKNDQLLTPKLSGEDQSINRSQSELNPRSNFKAVIQEYEPEEPMLPEHIENRTLDRICDLLDSDWSSSEIFETALPDLLQGHGFQGKSLEYLENFVQGLVNALDSSHILKPVAVRWLNNREQFNRLCQDELKSPTDSTTFPVDATYVEGLSTPSIFSEIRQVYRDNLRVALAVENVSTNAMYFPMKVASTAGKIALDLCHPPSIATATIVFSRLYGESTKFDPSIYSSGLSKFASETHFSLYASDLLQFRRVCHQSLIVSLMGKCLSNQITMQDGRTMADDLL